MFPKMIVLVFKCRKKVPRTRKGFETEYHMFIFEENPIFYDFDRGYKAIIC